MLILKAIILKKYFGCDTPMLVDGEFIKAVLLYPIARFL
jgi:hypothetical protein